MVLPAPSPTATISAESSVKIDDYITQSLGYKRVAYYVGWVVVASCVDGLGSFVLQIFSFHYDRVEKRAAGMLVTFFPQSF